MSKCRRLNHTESCLVSSLTTSVLRTAGHLSLLRLAVSRWQFGHQFCAKIFFAHLKKAATIYIIDCFSRITLPIYSRLPLVNHNVANFLQFLQSIRFLKHKPLLWETYKMSQILTTMLLICRKFPPWSWEPICLQCC